MSPHSSIPHALEVNSPPPWYKRPLFFGSLVVSTMVGVSLWSYIAHPAWLGESDSTNELINSILQVNPGLSRADLEQDIQMDNLSFWFGRSGKSYGGVQTVNTNEAVAAGEGSLLEQFMRGQEAAKDQSEAGAEEGTAAPATTVPTLAGRPETESDTQSDALRETRSALDIAINGIDEEASEALSPLQRALQDYQATVMAETSEAKAVEGKRESNGLSGDAPGLNSADTPFEGSIYETNPGLPPAAESVTGSSTRTSRTADPTATTEPVEVFTPRSRRQTGLPGFDPNAYRNTAAPPTTTANSNSNTNNNQRRQFERDFTDQGGFNRIGNGEIESFGNPLGSNNN